MNVEATAMTGPNAPILSWLRDCHCRARSPNQRVWCGEPLGDYDAILGPGLESFQGFPLGARGDRVVARLAEL